MGKMINDGPQGTKINVDTVLPGEFSAEDLKLGHIGVVRFKDGREKVFAGNLLLTALRNGGVLTVDPRFQTDRAWALQESKPQIVKNPPPASDGKVEKFIHVI